MIPTPNPKYTKFDYTFGSWCRDVKEKYDFLKLPYQNVENAEQKILFVVDYVPSEDLGSGRLLSGASGALLRNVVAIAEQYWLLQDVKYSWMAVNFNAFRTVGKSPEFQAKAREEFGKRVRALIQRYKPTVVVTLGPQPAKDLIGEWIEKSESHAGWYGVPVPVKIGEHKCTVVSTLSLNSLISSRAGSALIGLAARNVSHALLGRNPYAVDNKKLQAHKSVLIDTIAKFDKLMAVLREAEVVSVDTEARSLYRVTNKLLTVQFAKCKEYGYVIPIHHKDTPFLGDELKYIKTELRRFFEGQNKNKYHVYANAEFDLNLMRSTLGVRYFANNVWDIFAGEYCFDPETYVWTERGPIQIKDLVDMDDKPRVWSFNTKSGTPELKPILLSSRHSTNERLVEIEYDGGTIRVTENHKVWSETRKCYIEAINIQPDEEVLLLEAPTS